MATTYLVRVGRMGAIGRFQSVESTTLARGGRVIVRTKRGLEAGEVLAPATSQIEDMCDGPLLRAMTVGDHLLEARLTKDQQQAFASCQDHLNQLGLGASLLDVEYLMDGRTLIFYFLGEVSDVAESIVRELARNYDAEAGIRQFGVTLEHGCGPDCGTDRSQGCKTCAAGCALSGSCAH